jgi:hypothetical protein
MESVVHLSASSWSLNVDVGYIQRSNNKVKQQIDKKTLISLKICNFLIIIIKNNTHILVTILTVSNNSIIFEKKYIQQTLAI